MKKKTRKKKTRTGSNLLRSAVVVLAVLSAAGAGDKRQKSAEPYALVAGTVFGASGYALPGVLLTIHPKAAGGSEVKLRLNKATSDARGEFAFRVPPAPMRYTVRAEAKGFKPVEKMADVNGPERVDVTFMLEPESNE